MSTFQPRRVLVTGGAGFVGNHVVRRLLEQGLVVRVLARRTSDLARLRELPVQIVFGDLADSASLQLAVTEQDVLVNVATTMAGSERELELGTIRGTATLFKIAREAGVKRLVHISSIAVLPSQPPTGKDTLEEIALYETDPAFRVAYVKGKQAAEQSALEMAASGWEVYVLRPGIVYGPGGNWKLSRLGYAAGSRFLIVGNGNVRLPSIYVENLADAIAAAIQAPVAAAGIHHIIDEERFTQNEFLTGFRDSVQPQMKIRHLPAWIARGLMKVGERTKTLLGGRNPFHRGHIEGCLVETAYSTQRARQVLGWVPRVNKAEALRRSYVDWQRPLSRKSDLRALDTMEEPVRAIKVAIVGCGGISDVHTGFLRSITGVQIVGCYDVASSSAQRLAAKFEIPFVARTLEELIQTTQPEIVHVLTPPQYTKQTTIECLQRGCHVLVEKPMALNAEDAEEIIATANACGRRVTVDHNHVYDRVMVNVRRLVESGALGQITWVDSYYGFDLGGNPGNPLVQPDAGSHWNYTLPGGLFQNLLPHPLGVALEFIPGAVKLRAMARFFRVLAHQPADELRLILETPSTCGLVTVSLAASPKAQTLQLYGTKGCVFVDFTHKLIVQQRHIARVPRTVSRLILNLRWGWAILGGTLSMTWQVARKRWVHYDGMPRLFREFIRAVQTGSPVPVSPEEGLRVMRLMDETWSQIGPQTNEALRAESRDSLGSASRASSQSPALRTAAIV